MLGGVQRAALSRLQCSSSCEWDCFSPGDYFYLVLPKSFSRSRLLNNISENVSPVLCVSARSSRRVLSSICPCPMRSRHCFPVTRPSWSPLPTSPIPPRTCLTTHLTCRSLRSLDLIQLSRRDRWVRRQADYVLKLGADRVSDVAVSSGKMKWINLTGQLMKTNWFLILAFICADFMNSAEIS